MKGRYLFGYSAACGLAPLLMALGTPAIASEDELPAGWILAEGSSSCTASYELDRVGEAGRRPTLDISRSYRNESVRLVKLRIPLDYDVGTAGIISAELRLEGAETPLGSGLVYANASLQGSVGTFTLSEAGLAQIEAGTSEAVRLVVESADIELGSVTAALPATKSITFDACFDRVGERLMARGAAGEAASGHPRPPRPTGNPGRWVTANDYPYLALRAAEEGIVTVRLTISRFGFVRQCVVIGTSGSGTLDQTTCKQMVRRAEFLPARDAEDRAVEGSYTQSVSWMIPE
jgi:TonB family protein